MNKEQRLLHKLKRLLRRLGCPRWLHHYGPKTYEFLEHLSALLIRSFCRLSFRRVKQLLDLLGIRCPSKSALQYTANKLSASFWQRVLSATSGSSYLVALDSTGFSRTNPSYYYLNRIKGGTPKISVKMSSAFDTRKKKFCVAKIKILPSHDINDAEFLITHSQPKIVVADKAYDANWVHELCSDKHIRAYIPIRRWGKPRFRNMSPRMKAAKKFDLRIYHRRELIEAAHSSIKRKFGASVSSKKARTIRTEVYGRLACHNLFSCFCGTFRTEPAKPVTI